MPTWISPNLMICVLEHQYSSSHSVTLERDGYKISLLWAAFKDVEGPSYKDLQYGCQTRDEALGEEICLTPPAPPLACVAWNRWIPTSRCYLTEEAKECWCMSYLYFCPPNWWGCGFDWWKLGHLGENCTFWVIERWYSAQILGFSTLGFKFWFDYSFPSTYSL